MTITHEEIARLLFAPSNPWSSVTRKVSADFGYDAAASFHAVGVFYVAVRFGDGFAIAKVGQRFEHHPGIGDVLVGHDDGEVVKRPRTARAAKSLATRMNRANA